MPKKLFSLALILTVIIFSLNSCNKKNNHPKVLKNLNSKVVQTTNEKQNGIKTTEEKSSNENTSATNSKITNKSTKTIVKVGDTVSVMYIGKFKNGKIFDQSKEGQPLTFKVGAGRMIKGFDNAVIGMKLNEEKTVTIPADDAYGKRQKYLVHEFPKSVFPKNFKFEKGKKVVFRDRSNRPRRGVIVDFTKNTVTVDFNHPLAGKDLIFTIKVLDIK